MNSLDELGFDGLLDPLLEPGKERGGPVVVRRYEQYMLRGDDASDVRQVDKDAARSAEDAEDLSMKKRLGSLVNT